MVAGKGGFFPRFQDKPGAARCSDFHSPLVDGYLCLPIALIHTEARAKRTQASFLSGDHKGSVVRVCTGFNQNLATLQLDIAQLIIVDNIHGAGGIQPQLPPIKQTNLALLSCGRGVIGPQAEGKLASRFWYRGVSPGEPGANASQATAQHFASADPAVARLLKDAVGSFAAGLLFGLEKSVADLLNI